MAKTTVQNAIETFQIDLSTFMILAHLDNKGLAKLLGCSLVTVSKLRNDPFSVTGNYILMVQEYLRKEERKRYG